MKSNTLQAINAHLDEVAKLQYAWKNRKLQMAVCAIAKEALRDTFIWADDVVFETLGPEDKNIIGIAFRMAMKMRLIAQTGDYRKSNKKPSNGRIVWRYMVNVADKPHVRAFLKANDYKKLVAETSPELPLKS